MSPTPFVNRCNCGIEFNGLAELKAHKRECSDAVDTGEGWNMPVNAVPGVSQ